MTEKKEPLLLEENDVCKRIVSKGTNNKLQHQQSLQSNKQDLDQSVELDVKPSQVNLQHIDLSIKSETENSSGKIVGSVFRGIDGQLVADAVILLYFGARTEYPVYRTVSDQNGNYCIEDLPPGFYTIMAIYNDMQCISRNLKVFSGKICRQSLSLMQTVNYSYSNNW